MGAEAIRGPKGYLVEGTLKEVDLPARQLRILHDEIPGYMKKMVMLFDVKDGSDLETLKAGDRVKFKMMVTEDDGWIEQVTPIAASPAVASNPREVASTNTPPSPIYLLPLMVGDPVPDIPFTNQLAKPVLLSDYRGQVVVFSFIFTTCPFPTMCPRMSSHFKLTQALLKTDPSGPTNWHFFSVTIDPRTDTPAVLQRYAEGQGADGSHWSFLTGDEKDIEGLGRRFGLSFMREGGVLNHNLRTVVVNPQGKVAKTLIGNEWKPAELVEAMRAAR